MLKRLRALRQLVTGKPEDVDAYISAAPREVQDKLRELRRVIREAAPTAVESISYGIPYYDYKGRLAWFGASKTHIGLYVRPPVIQDHGKDLSGYETTKSAVRLPLDEEVPVSLVRKLVRARMKINDKEELGATDSATSRQKYKRERRSAVLR